MTYEILIIANPSLDEKGQKKLEKEISDLVSKEKGKTLSTQNLGVKKLATPMKEQETGAYLSLVCEMSKDKVAKITKSVQGNGEVINAFVFATVAPEKEAPAKKVATEEPKKTEVKKVAIKKTAPAKKKAVAQKTAKPKKAAKPDIASEIESEDDRLKKLDDQLDEILKD